MATKGPKTVTPKVKMPLAPKPKLPTTKNTVIGSTKTPSVGTASSALAQYMKASKLY